MVASQVVPGLKNPPDKAEDATDAGLIPGWGRSPGGGNGNSLQHSCLENSMDRGAWWATVHGAVKSQTQMSTHSTQHKSNKDKDMFQRRLISREMLSTYVLDFPGDSDIW